MSANEATVKLRQFHWPKTAIAHYVAGRTLRAGLLLGVVFAAYTASKALGFVQAYPTVAARQAFAATIGSNVGIKVLLGMPNRVDTIPGYITWNMLGVLMIIGAIWASLTATKYFRGEEESGRFELLLSGQTTAIRAAANVLAGLGCSLLVLYIVAAIGMVLIGKDPKIDYGVSAGLFFALATTLSAALFMAVGALASQLMPTRARATGFSIGTFGVFFLIRAMADVTNAQWLLNLTPLGWIEKLQPLYASQPIWLLPITGLIIALIAATLALAGNRDLGDSTFDDHDTARPRTWLLNSPLGAAFRLTRSSSIGWLSAISAMALLYGLLAKSAGQVLSSSLRHERAIRVITHSSQAAAATDFMGIIFFIQMTLIMAFASSSIGAIRKDEAEGYVDNFLARRVGRLQWLWGRIGLAAAVIILAGVLSGIAAWIGQASQHTGIAFHLLLLAGLNATAPALLTLGFGVLAFGYAPRLTSILAYAVVGWSFLLELLSSGVHLSHWILDTSVFNQVAFVPASPMNWTSASALVGIGLVLAALGAQRFKHRDLAVE